MKKSTKKSTAAKKSKPIAPEVQVLVNKFHLDAVVYGDDTEALAKYLEEESRARSLNNKSVIHPLDGMITSTLYNGMKMKKLDPKYNMQHLGEDGDFDEVSLCAADTERQDRYTSFTGKDDPWYDVSVRDELERSHYGGFHAQPSHYSACSLTRQIPRVGKAYETTPSTIEERIVSDPVFVDNLEHLIMTEAYERKGKAAKVIKAPFDEDVQHSKYTKDGTQLKEFNKRDLEKNINEALENYRKEEVEYTPQDLGDGFDKWMEKLGGQKALDKMATKWIKYATRIRGRAKMRSTLFDPDADLVEAVNHLNLTKVITILFREGNPDAQLADHEPLFAHLVCRAIISDAMEDSWRVGDKNGPDRDKMQKILAQMVKYKVNVDAPRVNGLTALHTAAAAGNAKLTAWLLENGANPHLHSVKEGMTPLMFASKVGHVLAMAEIVRSAGSSALSDVDLENGMTALHYAALMGQTRSSTFLLHVGANKRTLDKKGRTAGRIAQDGKHEGTSQAIACYSQHKPPAKAYMKFVQDKMEEELGKSIFDGTLRGAIAASLNFISDNVSSAANSLAGSFTSAGKLVGKAMEKAGVTAAVHSAEHQVAVLADSTLGKRVISLGEAAVKIATKYASIGANRAREKAGKWKKEIVATRTGKSLLRVARRCEQQYKDIRKVAPRVIHRVRSMLGIGRGVKIVAFDDEEPAEGNMNGGESNDPVVEDGWGARGNDPPRNGPQGGGSGSDEVVAFQVADVVET